MEGSCAGSSLTPPLVLHTWPTPSCLPPSLLSPTITLTTSSCLLLAHQWWAFISPSQAPTPVPFKQVLSTLSQQRSAKDPCPSDSRMEWPVKEEGEWSDLMSPQRYKRSALLFDSDSDYCSYSCFSVCVFSHSNIWVFTKLLGVVDLQQEM